MSQKPINPNTGFLWTNERENDRQPIYTGRLVISRDLVDAIWDGEELEIAAWQHEGRNGPFLSLKIKQSGGGE